MENTITHTELVQTLTKKGEDIKNEISADQLNLLHCAIGISGEVAELVSSDGSDENLIEELGDIEFYLEALIQGAKIDRILLKSYAESVDKFVHGSNLIPDSAPQHEQLFLFEKLLVMEAGLILDIVKKNAIYQKPLDQRFLLSYIGGFISTLSAVYKKLNISKENVKQANIEKLSKRYAGLKYSNQAAQERADKAQESC
jgi:NTP pyrophosphatase (non-canonical NTP hydrolase)